MYSTCKRTVKADLVGGEKKKTKRAFPFFSLFFRNRRSRKTLDTVICYLSICKTSNVTRKVIEDTHTKKKKEREREIREKKERISRCCLSNII